MQPAGRRTRARARSDESSGRFCEGHGGAALKLDLAFVVHHYDPASGTGGYVVELARRFAGAHDVTVYAAGFAVPVPEGASGVWVPALRGRTYATIMTFPTAFALVRRRHDVVHAQGWVASRADVVTAHIVLAAWRECAGAAGVPAPAGERWLGGFAAAREADLLRANAQAVIAPSRRAQADIAKFYGRTNGVHVVPHGFKPATRMPREEARGRLGLPLDSFVALYAGDARKGLSATLDAIAASPGVQLVVAGSNEDTYRGMVERLRIADRIHRVGHLPDLSPAYAAADVLLHPTIYDTFGLVVVEAMAHGLPVVVSRAAGAAELLTHGESGWILDTGSPTEVAAAIRALKGDTAIRQRLKDGGYAAAARRSWDDVAEDTLNVYRSLGKW